MDISVPDEKSKTKFDTASDAVVSNTTSPTNAVDNAPVKYSTALDSSSVTPERILVESRLIVNLVSTPANLYVFAISQVSPTARHHFVVAQPVSLEKLVK
jgi:hypothetical protein